MGQMLDYFKFNLKKLGEITGLGETKIKALRNQIFRNIFAKFIEDNGYLGSLDDSIEANIYDLVLSIILLDHVALRRTTKRKLGHCQEKQIISTNAQTGGYQEFLSVEAIRVRDIKFIVVIEAKQSRFRSAQM